MFRPAYHCEDTLGLATDQHHEVFKWMGHEVYFSCCRKGDALSAHFAAAPGSLREVKRAIEEFVQWVFAELSWCKMIFAFITKPSVVRLVQKCRFTFLTEMPGDVLVYVRYR